ncbi:MAG: PQQ-binding-like beta-propeller repeat protein [Candidatus Moduliflexus flocculans]|nr:PQQ-binding-like beta-propeller repeat protein [Candidatus Moduliflexus flocculans]
MFRPEEVCPFEEARLGSSPPSSAAPSWLGLGRCRRGRRRRRADGAPPAVRLAERHRTSARTAARPTSRPRSRTSTPQPGLAFVLVTGDVTDMGLYANFRAGQGHPRRARRPLPHHPRQPRHEVVGVGRLGFPAASGATTGSPSTSGGFRFVGLSQGPVLKFGRRPLGAPGRPLARRASWRSRARPGKPTFFVTHYPLDPSVANWYVVLDQAQDRARRSPSWPGTVTRTSPWTSRAWPGSWAGPTSGTKDVGARLHRSSRSGAKAVTFSERTGGPDPAALAPHRAREGRAADRHAPEERRAVRRERPRRPGPTSASTASTPRCRSAGGSTPAGRSPRPRPSSGETVVFGDASGADPGPARHGRQHRLGVSRRTIRSIRRPRSPADGSSSAATNGAILRARRPDRGARLEGPDRRPRRRQPERRRTASSTSARATTSSGPSAWTAGNAVWSYRRHRRASSRRSRSSPDGLVVFGAWDGRLYALDAKTGQPVWTWHGRAGRAGIYSPAACWPVAAERDASSSSTPDPWMTALELASGREIWGTDNLAVRESIGLSADGRRVYVRTTEDVIAADRLGRRRRQETVWETDAGVRRATSTRPMLVEKDGVVFYGTKNGLLLALDAATGRRQVEAPGRRRAHQHGDAPQRPGRGRHRLRRPRHPRLQRQIRQGPGPF